MMNEQYSKQVHQIENHKKQKWKKKPLEKSAEKLKFQTTGDSSE